ncbi:TPA: hypothetical protein HH296_15930 [Xanthomonas vasicola pv. zeae]|uniref:Uncharacterized protein n=1 Tax=Xanthomonas vasicola pv. vasculorum NCPPB 890 TaxID=1184265 RepID=A0A836P2E4_XANVA|nr:MULTISPECIES: hypothetical protein [Xanthomonas]MBV6747199.1 hypothetical protein [Xanthomonas vasicola pv. vasculorum NCPPB 890]MBV6892730.1 hypothetical protein [Xanthomonas vasicola pv. vasculorum]MDO6948482.1 hypothetical protein [Xanthomonas vasicola]MDO6960480.1 hypothetical protein [Xanthomonas vasicola]HHZ23900.1 hypothetical protein [Xanthomonas vasicola pv. zeae]
MQIKRLELRLRDKVPAERELIEALDERDGQYGGRNELMRECLQRGYGVLVRKVQELDKATESGNEMATLDALARAFDNEYSYRVVRTFLKAIRHRQAATSALEQAQEATPAPVQAPVDAPVEERKTEPPPAPSSDPGVVEPQEDADTSAGSETAADAEQRAAPEAAPGSKPKPNWGRFKGLAGSGDSGGSD